MAHDQIVARIQSRFKGHEMSRLVDAVLRADGWMTKVSPPGPDGGVDILAGRGSLGLDAPRLCVQVKSQNSPADVTVYRTLQGTMQTFKAEAGLLVCWGGFNKVVRAESKQGYFAVRLWDSRDLVEAIYRNYERLPKEIQAGVAAETGVDAGAGRACRMIADLKPYPAMKDSGVEWLGEVPEHWRLRSRSERRFLQAYAAVTKDEETQAYECSRQSASASRGTTQFFICPSSRQSYVRQQEARR